jgi:hypothetical protein
MKEGLLSSEYTKQRIILFICEGKERNELIKKNKSCNLQWF